MELCDIDSYIDNLPVEFYEKIKNLIGKKADVWFLNLPDIISDLIKKWQLYNLKPCEESSYNLIFFAESKYSTSLKTRIIIKITTI